MLSNQQQPPTEWDLFTEQVLPSMVDTVFHLSDRVKVIVPHSAMMHKATGPGSSTGTSPQSSPNQSPSAYPLPLPCEAPPPLRSLEENEVPEDRCKNVTPMKDGGPMEVSQAPTESGGAAYAQRPQSNTPWAKKHHMITRQSAITVQQQQLMTRPAQRITPRGSSISQRQPAQQVYLPVSSSHELTRCLRSLRFLASLATCPLQEVTPTLLHAERRQVHQAFVLAQQHVPLLALKIEDCIRRYLCGLGENPSLSQLKQLESLADLSLVSSAVTLSLIYVALGSLRCFLTQPLKRTNALQMLDIAPFLLGELLRMEEVQSEVQRGSTDVKMETALFVITLFITLHLEGNSCADSIHIQQGARCLGTYIRQQCKKEWSDVQQSTRFTLTLTSSTAATHGAAHYEALSDEPLQFSGDHYPYLDVFDQLMEELSKMATGMDQPGQSVAPSQAGSSVMFAMCFPSQAPSLTQGHASTQATSIRG